MGRYFNKLLLLLGRTDGLLTSMLDAFKALSQTLMQYAEHRLTCVFFARFGSFVGRSDSATFSRALILLFRSLSSNSTLKNPAQYNKIDKIEIMVAKEGKLCFLSAIPRSCCSNYTQLTILYCFSLLDDTVITSAVNLPSFLLFIY